MSNTKKVEVIKRMIEEEVCVCVWLPAKLALLTSSLSRLRAVDQLSPHSAVGRPGPRSVSAPGRLSQGRTQRVPDGRPIWPQCSHTVSAKHSSAMGAGACSRENNLSASHHDEAQSYVPPENIPGLTPKHAGSGLSTRSMHRSNETLVSSFYFKADA